MRKGELEKILFWPIIMFALFFGSIIGAIIGNYIWVVFVNYYFNNL
jgi:hypothetical protein